MNARQRRSIRRNAERPKSRATDYRSIGKETVPIMLKMMGHYLEAPKRSK